jgi:hypothetical protein
MQTFPGAPEYHHKKQEKLTTAGPTGPRVPQSQGHSCSPLESKKTTAHLPGGSIQ